MTKKEKQIVNYLNILFPNAQTELNFSNGYELIIAVVLSAQSTDVSVNKVTPLLFKTYPDFYSLSKAEVSDVENIIKSLGLFRSKARNIVNLGKKIMNEFDGRIPNTKSELVSLPGVGVKTANVVLSNYFNIPAFAVDTHVNRVSKRLGIADEDDSLLQVEKKLEETFPKSLWQQLHHQIILFGRYKCKSQNPECDTCELQNICNYYQENILGK